MTAHTIAFLLSIVSAPEFIVFILFDTITHSFFSALWIVLLISVGGSLGSSAIYITARMVGQDRCLDLVKKHGKKVLLKSSDMESINYYYSRWGDYIVFVGRWLPTFRSLVSIPAGLYRMPVWRFLFLTFSGTLVWNIILCSMIYGFRRYLAYLEVGLEGYAWVTFSAFLLLMVYFAVRRISERLIKGPRGTD
ncbi:MAG: DedA family protein [Desulfonatronovibrio sp.]